MTSTLPVTAAASVADARLNGHTRNKRAVDIRTCDTCPAAVKNSCSSVCSEMERYLDGNGGTISHNSPVAGQLLGETVTGLTDGISAIRNHSDAGATGNWFVGDAVRMTRLTDTSTPESLMLESEAAGKAETLILQHVAAFCETVKKEKERERSIVESIVVLHYLEGYTINRTAEILGERFEEFAGYRENERAFRSDRKQALSTPKVEREPKGRFKVARTLKKFQEYIRATHLSAAIHEVMVTGNVAPARRFAVPSAA